MIGGIYAMSLGICCAEPSMQGGQAANRQHELGQKEKISASLLQEAAKGNAQAQSDIALFYLKKKNFPEAVEWAEKAAKQEDPQGMTLLAECYLSGLGTEKNIPWAIELLLKAAQAGYTGAYNDLAFCYDQGIGVKQDLNKSFEYTLKAAEQCHTESQLRLGDLYYLGQGVQKNLTQSVQWWKKAADSGSLEAQCKLANAYYEGEGVSQNWNKAVTLWEAAANLGHLDSQKMLAYYYTQGTSANPEKVFKWCMMAAQQGDNESRCNTGELLLIGKGTEKNVHESLKWLEQAAEHGYLRAQKILASLYYFPNPDVKQNPEQAFKWEKLAAEQGDGEAQAGLGAKYYHGLGVTKDPKEAAKWLRKGYLQDAPNAMDVINELQQKVTEDDEDAEKILNHILAPQS